MCTKSIKDVLIRSYEALQINQKKSFGNIIKTH